MKETIHSATALAVSYKSIAMGQLWRFALNNFDKVLNRIS